MFTETRSRKRRAGVDLSALIDIVFLLLIFFSVTTTFLEQSGMDLELPESSTAEASERAEVLVEIGADGTIRLQGEEVTPEELERRVGELSVEDRRRITIRADRALELGRAVAVIDALRRGGVEGITLPMIPTER